MGVGHGVTSDPQVAVELPGARFLTLDGAGHPASFVPNACLRAIVERYVMHRELPSVGAVCQPELAPFGAHASR